MPLVPRQAIWGRWQGIADLPADDAKLALASEQQLVSTRITGSFFIARTGKDDLTLPNDGRFAFRLTSGEAYIIENSIARAAQIQSPQLELDFGKRSFSTSLLVVNGATKVDIQSRGDITNLGDLVGSIIFSNATVLGSVTGTNGQSASYIFNRNVSDTLRATGGTSWAR